MEADRTEQAMTGTKLLNAGQDDQMEITGYTRSKSRTVVCWIFITLTLGFLRLVFYWLPHKMIKAMFTVCELDDAEVVVLKDQYEQHFVSRIRICDKNGNLVNEKRLYLNRTDSKTPLQAGAMVSNRLDQIRYFVSKKVKYVWNVETLEFQKVTGLEDNVSCAFFYGCQGLAHSDRVLRHVYYGLNSIAVHVTPVVRLLFKQVLSPFYIFQVFSCGVWFYEEYYYYAVCIVVISIVSIGVTIYETRKMQRALRDTVDSATVVSVCQNEEISELSSEDLVPGDVLEIPRGGCIMQCDAVLVSGNCIVNESMLTGESVPVTKTPLPNPKVTHEDSVVYFSTKDHSRHILFSGTHVLQTRYYGGQHVRAVVFRTGFSTAKGSLVRSILFPKPVDFRFNKDTYKYIGVLAGIALSGMIFTIVLNVVRGTPVEEMMVESLDLITIAVPPALPAALTVGIVFAQRRMKMAKIYCISPRSINVCGSLNTVCFDKTGTLTEEGLDMHSIVPVKSGKFNIPVTDLNLIPRGNFVVGMATCHSLTIIDGVLSGDPLELIMFESIGWELTEPGQEESSRFDNLCPTIVYPKQATLTTSTELSTGKQILSEEIGIIRQFTFSSSLQRMSVVIRKLGDERFDIYTKGAPEMVVSLCNPDSVPEYFHDVLMGYTKHGYRVLALATKSLPKKLNYTKVQRIQREQVEKKLTFLGLIVMENRLKPATTPTIDVLKDANIRPIMVTGDNMLTALSVARECHIVMSSEPIYLVQGFPPQTDLLGNVVEQPFIEYVYTEAADEGLSKTHSGKGQTSSYNGSNYSGFDHELGLRHYYHFAVTGQSWSVLYKHFPEVLTKIVARGTIFARMSPDQKAQLVENLQELDYYVGMCGDGANDCGALKTAHAGISLSEAEASVASPFTSKTADISCVPTVIREGRCALVTSFGVFKYMACYSLTQFVSVLILYWVGVNLSDFEFLYVDLFLLTTLSITFGFTEAYPRLSKHPPLISLLSLPPILSLILHMAVIIGFQVLYYFLIQREPWFVPFVEDPENPDIVESYENTAVFYIAMYQYITVAIAFSKGRPYRKSMFTNIPFLINLSVCFGVSVWINMYPTEGVADFLETYILDSDFVSVKLQDKLDRCLPGARPKHEAIEDELRQDTSWPPVKTEDLAGTFQRLDSAFSKSNSRMDVGGDNDSLLGSETSSLGRVSNSLDPDDEFLGVSSEYKMFAYGNMVADASEIQRQDMVISTGGGHNNPAFVLESGSTSAGGEKRNISTRL